MNLVQRCSKNKIQKRLDELALKCYCQGVTFKEQAEFKRLLKKKGA